MFGMIKNDKTILWTPTFELIKQTNMASLIEQIDNVVPLIRPLNLVL